MTSRRDALRTARWKEKVEVEVTEALRIKGFLEEVREHVPIWVQRAIVENGCDGDISKAVRQALQDADYHIHASRMPRAQEMNPTRVHAAGGLCKFCEIRRELCKCGMLNSVKNDAPEKLLQDEYALLELAKAERGKAEEVMERLKHKQATNEYARDLHELMREQEEQREQMEREKQVERERVQREMEALRKKEKEDALRRREYQAKCADELDRFCQAQKEIERHNLQMQRDEELHLQKLAQQKQQEEEVKLRREREVRRQAALEEQQNLVQQAELKKKAHLEEQERDLEFIRQATIVDEQREARRRQEMEAMKAKQESIMSTVGAEIGRIECQRREAIENACERWEQENSRREAYKEAQKKMQRERSNYELLLARERQLFEKEQIRKQNQAAEQMFSEQLKQRIHEEEMEARRQMQEESLQKAQYRSTLKEQIEEEKRTRKERSLVGMNEVERLMNMDLLKEHNLIDPDSGEIKRTCNTGTCAKGLCTCSREIRELRYMHQMA